MPIRDTATGLCCFSACKALFSDGRRSQRGKTSDYKLRFAPLTIRRVTLTKGTIYPIVKSVAKWFNVKMTKEIFSSFFKKAIPVVGGVIGGGITYLSFGPCCEKLKASLKDTLLSNPNAKPEEDIVIDVECDEVDAE